MCGIVGVLGPNRDVTEPASRAALAALRHRGPDDEGYASLPLGSHWLSVAHARLSIIDLSPAGRQPMVRGSLPEFARGTRVAGDDGVGIVFNGEIYNYQALRHELEHASPPQPLGSTSDTEVLLHGLARDGLDYIQKLRGMFAFGVWEPRRARLHLVRDRLGIKPLYYTWAGEYLVFASEVRAVLATGLVEPKIDRAGLGRYLAYGACQDPLTIVDGVHALEAAHSLTIENGRPWVPRRYWSLPTRVDRTITHEEALRETQRLVAESVSMHMVADVPVGAFLSGGIDSSLVVALMSKASTTPVHTVTVVSQDGAGESGSELEYAELVAKRYGARHDVALLSAQDAEERARDAVRAMDLPSIDGVNSFVVSGKVRSSGATVALSGLGSDEIFQGYSQFKTLPILRAFAQLVGARSTAALAGRILPVHHIVGRKLAHILASEGDLRRLTALQRMLFFTYMRQSMVRPEYRMPVDADVGPELAPSESPDEDALNFVSAFELRGYVQNMLLRDSDMMSMAHGLELRVPFLDHELVEFALKLPGDFKSRPFEKKSLLVRAMRPLLPRQVYERRKMGFNLALPQWMRTSLRPTIERTLFEENEVLDPKATRALWNAFLVGDDKRLWSRVWGLVILLSWLRRYVWRVERDEEKSVSPLRPPTVTVAIPPAARGHLRELA